MTTLLGLIKNGLSYDSQWAVYAERVNGEFTVYSEARHGQIIFDNGGLLDDKEFFATNERILDFILNWTDGDDNFTDEAIDQLIDEINNNNISF